MAISALDVRDSFVAAPVRVALHLVPAPAESARRRLPATVVVAALVALVESVALLAAGLTLFDGVLSAPSRPSALVLALGLGALATWIVLCAGGGAALLDASGNRLYRAVGYTEFALIGFLFVLGRLTPVFADLHTGLPLAALGLFALALPAGKLLLAGSPSALAWVAQGPRPVERRPDPVARHRVLCTVTIAVIGLALGAVTMLSPAEQAGPGPVAATVVGGH